MYTAKGPTALKHLTITTICTGVTWPRGAGTEGGGGVREWGGGLAGVTAKVVGGGGGLAGVRALTKIEIW